MKVCGDAVLPYFWCGFAEIFILTCGISVLLDYAVCGLKNVCICGVKISLGSSSTLFLFLFF